MTSTTSGRPWRILSPAIPDDPGYRILVKESAFPLFGKKKGFSFDREEEPPPASEPRSPVPFSDAGARLVPWSDRLHNISPKFDTPSTSWRSELLQKNEGNIGRMEDEATNILISQYRETKDPRKLEQIYGLYQPSLDRMVASAAYGRLPEPAVRAKTYSAFKDAVDKYEPEHGKRFFNYFSDNHFRTAQNSFRAYSNFRKVVHQRASNLDAVDKIRKDLELTHGRDPTTKEIGKEYANLYGKTLRESELKNMMKEIAPEFTGSNEMDNSYLKDTTNQMYVASLRARDTVSKAEQPVFDSLFMTALEGGEAPTQKEVAAKHNMSTATLNRRAQEYRNAIMREYGVLTRG